MPKDDNIEAEGTVVECLRNAMFKVRLSNGHHCHVHDFGKNQNALYKDSRGRYRKA